MTETDRIASPVSAPSFRAFLFREWPYLLMIAATLIGVAFTSLSETPIRIYWIALAPFIGVVCVATRWNDAATRDERIRLIVTQCAHWFAVLMAMELIYIADSTRVLSLEASALTVLTVLALGTFTAGVHIWAWKICVVGALLAAAVPGIALLERSALLILLVVVIGVAIAAPFYWHRSKTKNQTVPAPPMPAAAPISALEAESLADTEAVPEPRFGTVPTPTDLPLSAREAEAIADTGAMAEAPIVPASYSPPARGAMSATEIFAAAESQELADSEALAETLAEAQHNSALHPKPSADKTDKKL
jgi:hypothetical protein